MKKPSKYDPNKPGVLGKIRMASSQGELNSAVASGLDFKSASEDTKRKWVRAAASRKACLAKQ